MTVVELIEAGQFDQAFAELDKVHAELDPQGPYVTHYPKRHACRADRGEHCLVCSLPYEVHP